MTFLLATEELSEQNTVSHYVIKNAKYRKKDFRLHHYLLVHMQHEFSMIISHQRISPYSMIRNVLTLEKKIKEEINQKARVFILVLTKNVFNRCYDKEDHLYTEIKYALSKAKKQPNSIIIIPFIPDRMFDFKKDFNVSNEFSYLKDIEQYNAQSVDFAEVTFRDSMDRFCKQLEEILVPIYQDRFIDAKRIEIATINGDSTHSKLTKKILKALGL